MRALLAPLLELSTIRTEFAELKKLSYSVQALEPKEVSAQWDAMRKASRKQFDGIESSIDAFLGAPSARWRPRFTFYYVLPIVLHLTKLVIFCSRAGILGTLGYDVLVFLLFGLLRHPYAVAMTVSYSSDQDALPHMIKVAAVYLGCAHLLVPQLLADDSVISWGSNLVPRLDMRPMYTFALAAYAVFALGHQAYTLYHERSWKDRRAWEVGLSLISHQVSFFRLLHELRGRVGALPALRMLS